MKEVKLTKEIVQGLFEVLERIYHQVEDQEDKLTGAAMFSEKLIEDGFLSERDAEVFNTRLLRAKNHTHNVKEHMQSVTKILEENKLEKYGKEH